MKNCNTLKFIKIIFPTLEKNSYRYYDYINFNKNS